MVASRKSYIVFSIVETLGVLIITICVCIAFSVVVADLARLSACPKS